MRTEIFEQAAVNLQIPILLIRGKLSDVVSPEGVQHFLATVPRAEFAELPNAGHTAAGDDNDAFSGAVVTSSDQPRDRGDGLAGRLLRVSAELLAHRRQRLVGEVVEAARGEAGLQRRR